MKEQEFDWPEEMPEGFWKWCSSTSARALQSRFGLQRVYGEAKWSVVKFGVGNGWAATMLDNAYLEISAYTALREHVLREREERAAGAAHLQACEDHWDDVIKARITPPERAERPWDADPFPFSEEAYASLNWLADRLDKLEAKHVTPGKEE